MSSCEHSNRSFVVRKEQTDETVCWRCKDAMISEGWILTMESPAAATKVAGPSLGSIIKGWLQTDIDAEVSPEGPTPA